MQLGLTVLLLVREPSLLSEFVPLAILKLAMWSCARIRM
jgi:hypothetical protein